MTHPLSPKPCTARHAREATGLAGFRHKLAHHLAFAIRAFGELHVTGEGNILQHTSTRETDREALCFVGFCFYFTTPRTLRHCFNSSEV